MKQSLSSPLGGTIAGKDTTGKATKSWHCVGLRNAHATHPRSRHSFLAVPLHGCRRPGPLPLRHERQTAARGMARSCDMTRLTSKVFPLVSHESISTSRQNGAVASFAKRTRDMPALSLDPLLRQYKLVPAKHAVALLNGTNESGPAALAQHSDL